jgi:hypothetical protein
LSALRLELSPSPRLALLILALHCGAGAAALAVAGGIPGAALCVALVALGAAAAWSRALHLSPASVRVVELEGSRASLTLGNGRLLSGELAERRYVSRLAVALPLRRPVGRTIFVTADMLDVKSFRALRLWALWGKLPTVASRQLQA